MKKGKDAVRLLLLLSLISPLTFSAQDLVIRLWAEIAPKLRGVQSDDVPIITMYPPKLEKATESAIMICMNSAAGPAEKEARDIAQWLQNLGVTAVVLKYRAAAQYGHDAPMTDAARAIRLLRAQAAQWRINRQRIGIMGFLSNGHVASTSATHFSNGAANAEDPVERVSSRPDALILFDPVITMTSGLIPGDLRKSLIGDTPSRDLINYFSAEKHVSPLTPPTFLYYTDNNQEISVENSRLFAQALQKAKIPYESHTCDKAKEKDCNHSNSLTWRPLLEKWLAKQGFLRQKQDSSKPNVAVKQRIPSEIESLITEARSVPPEYGADALLRIIELTKIEEAKWKEALIEEAFFLAGKSQQPFKRNYLPGSSVDTRDGYLSYAFALKLDALSLQCRAVKAMLAVNKPKARELFSSISQTTLPELKCDDTLIYDVTDFYDTLKEVTHKTFTPEQVSLNEQIHFIQPYISNINSPLQVGPVAKMIQELKVPALQFEFIVRSFSNALGKISGDDRSFFYATNATGTPREIGRVIDECKKYNVVCNDLLLAFRDYLIKHFHTNRCLDNVVQKGELRATPSYIDWFNKTLRLEFEGSANILPISADDIKPLKTANSAVYYDYWRTPQAKKLLQGVRELRFGPQEKSTLSSEISKQPQPLSLSERESLTWQRRLIEFLNDLEEWKPTHEASNADYFHQKCVLLEGLVVLTPAGALREKALREYITFLALNQFQLESIAEWLFHVRSLVSRFNSGSERNWVLGALNTSGDPILGLHARLEKLASQSVRANQQNRSGKQ